MGNRLTGLVVALVCLLGVRIARADDHPWQVAIAAGGELWRAPKSAGNGFALVDAQRGAVRGSRFHVLYNTDTVQIGLEGVQLRGGKLELSIVGRGEALLSGLLFTYYQQGVRNTSRAFFASYGQLLPSLKWHPADHHSLEFILGMRVWSFSDKGSTASTFVLPPTMFVFEPRVSYTYWNIDSDAPEFEAHRLFPRITGLAFGVTLGLDRRTNQSAWGADVGGGQLDPRNRPGQVIFTLRQWAYAGKNLGAWGRLQLEEHASYGHGEDDLTRNRVGGMNPYVIPIAGLPWAALLSERLVAGQVSLHVKVGHRGSHEIGAAVNGGAFNDVRRTGQLTTYGGAGGLMAFADLRVNAWQVHVRAGWSFPVSWLIEPPYFSGLVTAGVRIR